MAKDTRKRHENNWQSGDCRSCKFGVWDPTVSEEWPANCGHMDILRDFEGESEKPCWYWEQAEVKKYGE